MKIAIFDYRMTSQSPAGSCHLHLLQGLCEQHDFTVFAVEFENPCPRRIRWFRIPCPKRPLALLFVSFHLLAPLFYLACRLRHRVRFDVVQMVESNLVFGDISYAHFCHRVYLRKHWKQSGYAGLRALFRWLDHWMHAVVEPLVFHRIRRIVVPSQGLARELSQEYPAISGKIHVLANPVAVEQLALPSDFDRSRHRSEMGLGENELGIVFVALGHFERKGLPLLVDALSGLRQNTLKLLVVGGVPDLVSDYRRRMDKLGLSGQVRFLGMQRDVRPYLWAADAFALPSSYEVFPLVVLQAAAAGLPMLVTPVYGVEEFARDGENVILVDHTSDGVRRGLERLVAMSPEERAQIGKRAQGAIARYSTETFVDGWREFYQGLN